MDTLQETWRIGRVVELCNQIELYMTAIIEAYVAPPANREAFLRSYVLNSAIVSFASKIKLVLAINDQTHAATLDVESIRKVGSLRNAFAHNDLISGIRVADAKTKEDEPPTRVVVESVDSRGRLQTIDRDEAWAEFVGAHEKAESCLREMLSTLRS